MLTINYEHSNFEVYGNVRPTSAGSMIIQTPLIGHGDEIPYGCICASPNWHHSSGDNQPLPSSLLSLF